MLINKTLEPEMYKRLTILLMEFCDIFAWNYKDMKGIDPKFYQHWIDLREDTVPIKQHKY